jgi:hypothetical protein
MRRYDLNAKAAQEVRDQLEARRGKKTIYTKSNEEGVIDEAGAPAST